MPKIIVTCDRFGKTAVTVEGAHGGSCVEKTQTVEQALAGNATRELKPEFYDDAAASTGIAATEGGW